MIWVSWTGGCACIHPFSLNEENGILSTKNIAKDSGHYGAGLGIYFIPGESEEDHA